MEPMSSALPGHSEPPQPMANWMGNVVLGHASVAAPSTIAQLQQTVRAALPPLRVLGSGHSFTPLCHCDGGGTLVSLRNLRRVWDLRPGTGSDGAASVVCEGGSFTPPMASPADAALRTPFAPGPFCYTLQAPRSLTSFAISAALAARSPTCPPSPTSPSPAQSPLALTDRASSREWRP